MPAFDPVNATGVLCMPNVSRPNGYVVLGTCFLFRFDNTALTAAHCITDERSGLFVLLPNIQGKIAVSEIVIHSTADIAILRLNIEAASEGYPVNAFWDCVSNYGLAEELLAYGYPDEANEEGQVVSSPRVFVGYFQRFFSYKHQPRTYAYWAGEMSIGAPVGLSGGPVFRRGAPQMLMGMVTADHESYTINDQRTEVSEDGVHTLTEEVHKVITYGICLMLDAVKPWLKENIPERSGVGWLPGSYDDAENSH